MTCVYDMLENKASFSSKIIELAKRNEITLLDALTEYCKTNKIECEDIVGLLTNEFKALLHKEAVDLNIFRTKTSKFRFD